MSADQLKKFIASMDKLLDRRREAAESRACGRGWTPGPRTRRWSAPPAAASSRCGLPEERLLRFPADQVILLDEKRECEVRFDDIMKTMTFPSGRSKRWLPRSSRRRRRRCSPMPWCRSRQRVRRAQARLDQRIALLRHVEALRLYAAEHNGTLPAKLSDISVPLPDDPFTGKPFRYEVIGNTAHLRGTPPAGEENDPVFNIHYEVTVQK